MATKSKKTEQEQQVETVAAEPAVPAAPAFTKKQIVTSELYAHRRDLLNALLNDKKTYTHAEIEEIINNALSGKYQLK